MQNLGRSNYGFHYELSRRLHRPPRGSLIAVPVSKIGTETRPDKGTRNRFASIQVEDSPFTMKVE
jgi:hypothetical protein